jgi:hypothetical protein
LIQVKFGGGRTFVCNMSMNWLVKIPVIGTTAGTPAIFATGIHGCDGIAIDANGNLFVAASQANEIDVIDSTGEQIAALRDFNGVQNGQTHGLLFPANLAFSKDSSGIWVSNLELDLTTLGLPQSMDSKWAAGGLPVSEFFPAF